MKNPWPPNQLVLLDAFAPGETLDAPGALVVAHVLHDAPDAAAARKHALFAAKPLLVERLDVLAVPAKPAVFAALVALDAFDAPVAGARMAALVVAHPVLDAPAVLLAIDPMVAAAKMAALIAAHPVLVE